MLVRHSSAIFSALCVLLLAANASATDPSICDPEEDPNNCECPNDGTYDVCHEVPVSELISPDDPAQLRAAANIESTWDADLEAYRVTADATALTAAGVMKLNSNRGQWSSVEELHKYVGALIGQDLGDVCQMDRLPPMMIQQTGVTTRYDQFNEKWASVNSGSILYDAITNENGVLFIGDTAFDLFGSKSTCSGEDPKSFDSDSSGKLAGSQCSFTASGTETLCDREWSYDPCFPECRTYSFKTAFTSLETSSTVSFGNTLRCRGSWLDDNLVCTPEQGVIVHGRVRADKLDLQNFYFDGGAGPYDGDPINLTDAVEAHDSETGDGVCGHGSAEEGASYNIDLETRDGAYDSNAPACSF